MLAYTYIEKGKFALVEKLKPTLIEPTDAIVRVTMSSICSSDLHIKHGSLPRAVPGITVGHEMVGVVEAVGAEVTNVKPGDRVTVNVETFCGECFFCKNGYVNNCTNPNGGWALGCRIDGGQTEYVRVPLANQGLNRIPDSVTDEQALLVGDVLATGFWAARISEITEDDTVLIIGAGPTGICTLLCVMLKQPKRIIVCEKSEERRASCKSIIPMYCSLLLKHVRNSYSIIALMEVPIEYSNWLVPTTPSASRGSVPVQMRLLRWLPSMTNLRFFLSPKCMARTLSSRLVVWMAVIARKSFVL